MQPDHLARLPVVPSNQAATDLVVAARQRVVALFARHGCGFFQIGRAYPYRASRDGPSWALIEAIKTALDPHCTMNPGSLGLDQEPAP
jgi:D-lactate dehydrogenase (cytochrome)